MLRFVPMIVNLLKVNPATAMVNIAIGALGLARSEKSVAIDGTTHRFAHHRGH